MPRGLIEIRTEVVHGMPLNEAVDIREEPINAHYIRVHWLEEYGFQNIATGNFPRLIRELSGIILRDEKSGRRTYDLDIENPELIPEDDITAIRNLVALQNQRVMASRSYKLKERLASFIYGILDRL